MIRLSDIIISLILITLFFPIFIIIIVVNLYYYNKPILIQRRIGYNSREFFLFKIRTMPLSTPYVSTHNLKNVKIPKWSKFLRNSKLDEIPQLLNVLIGNMSMIGPRPNLINQKKIIDCRISQDIYAVKPGLTGLAQLKSVTMEDPKKLTEYDRQLIKNLNIGSYYSIIFRTLLFLIGNRNSK